MFKKRNRKGVLRVKADEKDPPSALGAKDDALDSRTSKSWSQRRAADLLQQKEPTITGGNDAEVQHKKSYDCDDMNATNGDRVRSSLVAESSVQDKVLYTGAKKVNNPFGPMSAPQHLRVTTHFDYMPDVCKDYKQTGFCGYGDNCKFMHDRSDYKAGWQIERDWQAEQLKKSHNVGKTGKTEDRKLKEQEIDDDDLPFACFICRREEGFVNPVVTRCGHYFCEKCALERFKKNSKCAVCNEQTMGIFNGAPRLEKKLARRRKIDAEIVKAVED